MNLEAEVRGVETLVAACDAVAAALTDPTTGHDAALLVADAGRPAIPRDTGHLASTETVTTTATGGRLDYTALYSVPVHTLRPWLPAAITAATAPILNLYTDRVTAAWS